MKHYIYLIFDKLAEAYNPNVMTQAPDEVIANHQRAVKVAIRKEDVKTLEMFEDKVIYLGGVLDDESGVITTGEPKLVIDLDVLVKPVLEAAVKHD